MFRIQVRRVAISDSSSDCLVELSERIAVLMQQDLGVYSGRDQARSTDSAHRLPVNVMDPKCRRLIGEWFYKVADKFQLDRDVVLTAFSFVDRFLCNEKQDLKPSLLRILSVTALMLSTKLHAPREVTMKLLACLSLEVHVSLLAKMELLLLRSLRWQVHPPTAKAAIRELIRLLAPRLNNYQLLQQVSDNAHYFAELAALNPKLVGEPIFKVAISSILNALNLTGSTSDMSTITKTFLDDCCNISGTQNCPVINDLCLEQVSLVQDLLWADYLVNLECALLRPYGDSMVEEPTPKRTRRDSPVSPMHIFP